MQRSIEVAELEKQIHRQLRRIEISATFKKWSFEYLQEVHRDDLNVVRHAVQSRERAYTDCEKRLENLVKLKTSPENADGSLLSDEEYSKRRRELLQEKAKLGSPEDIKRQAEWALRQSEEAFELAESARRKFLEGDFRVKKGVLVAIGSNPVLMDKKLIVRAKRPFALIEAFKSGESADTERIEPENASVEYGRSGRITTRSSRQLRGVKEVRTNERKMKNLVSKVYHYFRSASVFSPHIWN
jgi:hypothetical protein